MFEVPSLQSDTIEIQMNKKGSNSKLKIKNDGLFTTTPFGNFKKVK